MLYTNRRILYFTPTSSLRSANTNLFSVPHICTLLYLCLPWLTGFSVVAHSQEQTSIWYSSLFRYPSFPSPS